MPGKPAPVPSPKPEKVVNSRPHSATLDPAAERILDSATRQLRDAYLKAGGGKFTGTVRKTHAPANPEKARLDAATKKLKGKEK